MVWIGRPADAQIAEWLERTDAGPLLTVHGLGGSGSSSAIARALGRRAVPRADLGGLDRAAIRDRLRALPRAELVFVDQVHRPRAARAAIESLLARSRVIVSARAPLGSSLERCVPMALLDAEATRSLLAFELERLGVHPVPELDGLVSATEGWPLAVRAAAVQARVLGAHAVSARAIAEDATCGAVLLASVRPLRADRRAMLDVLSLAQAGLRADELVRRDAHGIDALGELIDRGLVIARDGLVRSPAPVAAFVRRRLSEQPARAAKRAYVRLVLEEAERARAAHRRDPVRERVTLERLRIELGALTFDAEPALVVRAALALEPLAIGRLARPDAIALWGRARAAARSLDERDRAAVALGLVRTLIARGDHESAERVLLETPELPGANVTAAYRAIYLAHIAAWRNDCETAASWLDEADRALEEANDDDANEDAALQRLFVAHQRGELDTAERLARTLAGGERRPASPRIATIARSFSAEIAIDRGAPARAVPLLRQARDELAAQGDHSGSVFLTSRLVVALEAAGDSGEAAREASVARAAAARAGDGTLEVALLGSVDDETVSAARVADLAWRVQIPLLRENAERWLAGRTPREDLVLRLDHATSTATLGARTLELARRATLWRVLSALADAHGRLAACDSETLFRAGWAGERAEITSQKKRVQTAVWTLRRGLLGDALVTRPEGYALSSELGVEHAFRAHDAGG